MHISENVRDLQPSATLGVAALCRRLRAAGRTVLDLSAGEPDFRTPEFAAQAGIAAIEQGFTQYTPVPGTDALREAIAAYITRSTHKPARPAGVVVSAGAKQALFNACFTLFGPGDDVLVPIPYWTSYPEIIRLARARPVYVAGDFANAQKVDVAALEAARTSATRGLILNSPSNPSGAIYTRDELDAIMLWAAEHELWVISDEIYGRLCFTMPRATSVLDLDPSLLERTVLIDGASKAFAMTGWRIGFSYCAPELASRFNSLQSHITSGASSPAQAAALAVYREHAGVEESVRAMVRVFHRRCIRAMDLLTTLAPQASFTPPEAGFYIYFRADAFYTDEYAGSEAFCSRLVEQTGVALVPGSAFGDDRFVRLSFAAPEGEVLEGIRRFGELVNSTAVLTA